MIFYIQNINLPVITKLYIAVCNLSILMLLYMFLTFLSLFVYYRILKLLKKKQINRKISVKDALLQLSKIYMIDVGDRTMMAEIPKKARELAETIDLKPELFSKNIPS